MVSDTFGAYTASKAIAQRDGETLYAGTHNDTKRDVVIRCFQKSSFDNDKVAQRVEKDAIAMVQRHHKNLLMCLDAGNCERGVYVVFEKRNSATLLDLITGEGGRLGEHRCFEILYDCALALSCLEDSEVVHRNLRPHNIFIQGKGEAIVADIALTPRSASDEKDVEELLYMSPQYIEGKTRIDIRDDIYALGVIGLKMLGAGRGTVDVETCECSEKAKSFLRNCVHKDRNKRYHSAEACAIAIEEVMYGIKRPETKTYNKPKSSKHSRADDKKQSSMPIIIGVIFIAIVVGTLVFTSPIYQKREQINEAKPVPKVPSVPHSTPLSAPLSTPAPH